VLDEICELPDYFRAESNYHMEYDLLGITTKAKIDAYPFLIRHITTAPIHNTRLFHIFVASERVFIDYVEKFPTLELRLLLDGQSIGVAHCDISEFVNPIVLRKNYY
jgi:hypothetical protein